MDIFPTQYSLLSAAALKNSIEKHYGFPGLNCRLLIHNVSDTYLLENEAEKYILKIYRDAHRKLTEIKGELELLNILYAKGIPVSYPLKDLNNQEIQSFNAAEGTRYGVLFTYAKGKVEQQMDDEQLRTLGCQMANMHIVTAGLELSFPRHDFNLQTTLIEPLEVIKPAFAELPQEYEYLLETSKRVYSEMEKLDPEQFSYGYCHYDFLPKNFHFQENGEITFFDFDFAGKGHLVNDLACFYVHYFLDVMFGKLSQQEADRSFKVFLSAYAEIRPLSEAEIAAIPYFGYTWWVFYLRFQYEHFEDWSNFFFSPKFLKDRVGWIKRWAEQHQL